MIAPSIYKLIHFVGVFLVLFAMGGLRGGKAQPAWRSLVITHGIGLTLAAIGGFGLLAQMGLTSALPLWAVLKLCIWVLLGAVVVVPARKPEWSKALVWVVPALAGAAAWLAIAKP